MSTRGKRMVMGRNAEKKLQPIVVIILDGWNVIIVTTLLCLQPTFLYCVVQLNTLNTPGIKKIKVSFYIAQYPVFRTAQSALHFTPLADMFTQTPSQSL